MLFSDVVLPIALAKWSRYDAILGLCTARSPLWLAYFLPYNVCTWPKHTGRLLCRQRRQRQPSIQHLEVLAKCPRQSRDVGLPSSASGIALKCKYLFR